MPTFNDPPPPPPPSKQPFENIEGKGQNAGNQYFLFFPQRFLLSQRKVS